MNTEQSRGAGRRKSEAPEAEAETEAPAPALASRPPAVQDTHGNQHVQGRLAARGNLASNPPSSGFAQDMSNSGLVASNPQALHARGCGCASCLGGAAPETTVSPQFVEIRGGKAYRDGQEVDASTVPGGATSDREAPAPTGTPGKPLNAGAIKSGRHPEFPAIYGQTFYMTASLPQFPRLDWDIGWTWTLGKTAKPKVTSWGTPSWPVTATPANKEGYKVGEDPENPGFEKYVVVGDTAGSNILAAENQHVADLDAGWDLTAKALGDAINAMAGAEPAEARDETAAKRKATDALVARLGPLGAAIRGKLLSGGQIDMGSYMETAYSLSGKARDKTGNHSWPASLTVLDHDAKKATYEVDQSKPLDPTPASGVVNAGTILAG